MATPVSSPSSLCHPGLVTSSALLSIRRTAQELGQVTLAVRFTQSNLQIIAQLDMGPSCTLIAAPFLRVWQCSVHPGMLRISRRNTTRSTSFPTSSSEEKEGWVSDYVISPLPLHHLFFLSMLCFKTAMHNDRRGRGGTHKQADFRSRSSVTGMWQDETTLVLPN